MTSRNTPCACGSGKRFKQCCGALDSPGLHPQTPREMYTDAGWFLRPFRGMAMRRFCPEPPGAGAISRVAAPPGILVVDGFLGAALCKDWCTFMDKQSTQWLGVQDVGNFEQSGDVSWENHAARVTETIDLAERKTDVLREVVRGYRDYTTRFFQQDLDTIEQPSVLKYGPGGLYQAHSDSEYWDESSHTWKRSLDRDYSILIYLNEGFEGGALYFPNFDFRIAPKRGMLVAFPSDHRYLHAAESLISGTRFAVVSWAKAKTPQGFSPFNV
jgi:hypothetical protein